MKKKSKSKYPPLSSARAQAIDLQLGSSTEYRDYIRKNKISYLPRYPERVYKDWVNWNDYLGTTNTFGTIKKTWRPWFEAVKWAQSFAELHDLKIIDDWVRYWKEHKDELPDDIPLHAEAAYSEFDSWKTWLGSEVRARIAIAKVSTALITICSKNTLQTPGNHYVVIQSEQGEVQLRKVLNKDPTLKVVKSYRMENEMKEKVIELFKEHGRYEGDMWFIPLIGNLLFELDMLLMPYSGMKVG